MVFVILLNLIVYALGTYSIIRLGGVKKNLTFTFSIFLFTIYYFITPVYFYFTNRKTIWGEEGGFYSIGVDISDYYDNVLLYYGLANLFFIIGYLIPKQVQKNIVRANYLSTVKFYNPEKKALLLLMFFFIVVLVNFIISGFDLISLLRGNDEESIGGVPGSSNYLKNFADTIIILLVISFYFKLKKIYLIPATMLSFFLFVLLFFRYRVILSLIGFFFSFLYKTKVSLTFYLKLLFSIFIFSYLVLFSTFNRKAFVLADWDNVVFRPDEFDYEIFFDQTRGMLDDINIIKYYEVINPDATYDYGVTFLYFIVRALPRSLIGSDFKDSLYPPHSFAIIKDAYDLPDQWGMSGEAPLHLAYFYIAGGLFGLFLLSFMTGFLIRKFQNRFPPFNDLYIILNIAITISMFQ